MRITANHITLARIFLLPVPCGMLIFCSLGWQYVALALYIAIAIGDLFDGILARRQGPTQFGAMLDPLADKLFIASIMVPFGAVGWAPAWVPAALLAREFIVTGLRSQTAVRDASIKTSVLAKLKTSIQMAGVGFVFLHETLSQDVATWAIGGVAVGAVLFYLGVALRKRGHPSAIVWVPVAMIVLALIVHVIYPSEDVAPIYCYVILAFTWGSGLDYLFGSARVILRDGVRWLDAARLWWTVAAVAIAAVVIVHPGLTVLVVIAIGAEFAVGGVDNLRALSAQPTSSTTFFVRSTLSLVIVVLLVALPLMSEQVLLRRGLGLALALLSLGYAAWDMIRARSLYAGKAASAAYSTAPPPRTAAG